MFLTVPLLIVIPMSFSASQYLEFPPREWSLLQHLNYGLRARLGRDYPGGLPARGTVNGTPELNGDSGATLEFGDCSWAGVPGCKMLKTIGSIARSARAKVQRQRTITCPP